MAIATYFDFFPKRNAYPISIIGNDYSKEINMEVAFPDFYRQVSQLSYSLNDSKYYYVKERILDGERPDQMSLRLYGTMKYYWTFFFINDHIRLGERLQWPLSEEDLRRKIKHDFDYHTLIGFKRRYLLGFLPNLLIMRDNTFINKPFIIGEEIRGAISNARGILTELRPNYGQMIVKMTTDQVHFRKDETVMGMTSNQTFLVHDTIEQADAPMYYEDENGLEITNPNFLQMDRTSIGEYNSVSFKQHLFRINENLSIIRVLKKDSLSQFENTFRELIRKRSFGEINT